MGNPLACAVANASIKLLLESNWQADVLRIEAQLTKDLSPLASCDFVKDVRCLGAVGVVEMTSKVDIGKIQKDFVADGVWIRPFDTRIYVMPPYIISTEDLTHLTSRIVKIVSKVF
jgi:adenosylmethionine-8-amino-7-oxononanoate aminotransferase